VTTAKGTFDVELVPAAPELDGAVNRLELRKRFHGDLEGEGTGMMLGAGDPSGGSAGYVAIEMVRGALHGRLGGFAFVQLGVMHAGSQTLHYEVVPGSGSGELEGITGRLQLSIEADGTHRFELTYGLDGEATGATTEPADAAQGPVFDQFNLVVSDMEASVEFYRRLGLTIPDTVPDFQPHHRAARLPGGIDLDLDSVEFARHWDRGWRSGMGVLGFRVATRDAVDAVYAELTGAGYTGQQEPWDAFWGARFAVVEDPDGNAVGITSPIDPGRRADAGFP
jgi:catechol 2,3-dioxygenase-like lactoylglutathione lyase family enzyme